MEVVMKRRDFVRTMCYGGLATFEGCYYCLNLLMGWVTVP